MTIDIHAERILILDFGSQYTQLIARRVREVGIFCEIHPFNFPEEDIKAFKPKGIILSGGPESVSHPMAASAPEIVFNLKCPVLGICYGMQLMAKQFGGEVLQSLKREFGGTKISIKKLQHLLSDIEDSPGSLDVWMSHGDHVATLPQDFALMASSESCEIVGMFDSKRHFYGVQFHPEVSHTKQGKKILARFVLDICGCQPLWTTKNIIAESIDHIKKTVGQDRVILGLSGGVDSSVVATLLQRAIGKQLTAVFVDTGLLRLNEAEEVKQLFNHHLGMHLITVDAKERFLRALKSITDPEDKRKIIGKLFVEIFEEEAQKIKDAVWLAQGTIYTDVIESAAASTKAHIIKSHHNVAGLPKNMRLQLLEPLRELFKDEVRKLGVELNLPYHLVYRHPFPGPGLAVRILGEVKEEYVKILQLADAILMDELHKHDLYYKLSQAFLVFLPIKSVGVQGDGRRYNYVVAMRLVETTDFMTAHIAKVEHTFLENISNRIINAIPDISRVVYDISSKPPATIEWE